MRVSDLGEFSLIERLRQIVASEQSPDVIVGIGDDTAVLADRDGEYLLATVDGQVENVHFLPFLTTPRQLGRRALVVNLSDIAAMGGRAQFAFVALALPASTSVEWVEEFYRGMRAEADRSGTLVVGGNLTHSPGGVYIDITVLGRVRQEHLLLRSGAQVGDRVLVTGPVGDAYTGLHLVFNPRLSVPPPVREKLITRYMEPAARLPEAAVIARSGQASAMIDVSDGLNGDIGHICDQSQRGVRLWADQLPTSPEARQVAEAMNAPIWRLALEGGDDYGLCFTAPPAAVDALSAAVERETGTTVSVIGEILPAEQGRWLVLPDGQEIPLATSWQHFQQS
jgi:thiamine-monophosphate kinase